jgi:hypothetical protein
MRRAPPRICWTSSPSTTGAVQDGKVLHQDEYAEMAQLVLR